ncbi:MAG: MBL fold metallo-hydrolase [Thermoprotei archaeon]
MFKYFLHSALLLDGRILVDPHDGVSIGLPRIQARPELVLVSHNHYDHNACELFNARCMTFVESTDYSGYNVRGLLTYHDKRKGKERGKNMIYVITTPDGRKIVHLGDLGHDLKDEQVRELRGADLLAIPVGGVITIGADEALNLINRIGPKNVLPIHYWVKGHYMPIDPIDEFLKKAVSWKIVNMNSSEIDEKSYSSSLFTA